jgi:hypothetical protein
MPGGLVIRAAVSNYFWSRPLMSSTCRGLDFAGHARDRVAFDLGVWGLDLPDVCLLLAVLGLGFEYLDVCYRAAALALQFSCRP